MFWAEELATARLRRFGFCRERKEVRVAGPWQHQDNVQWLLPGVPCHRLHSIHRLSLVFAPRRSEQAARHESPRGRAMLGTPLTCYPSTCSSPKSPRSGSQGAPPVAGSFVMHPGEAWLSASPTDPISSDWYYRCDLGEMVFFSFHFPGQRPSLLFVK